MDDRPRRADHLRMRDLGDEVLFYDEDGRRIHVLNGAARHLWTRLDGRRTIEQLIENLVAEYEVSTDRAREDVHAFIERLDSLGLIRR